MNILIIDDDADIRDIMCFALESEIDAEFLQASSGNQAIEIITQNNDIDLIISDYEMPDGTGGKVYKFLIDNNLKIPFVLSTGGEVEDYLEFTDKSGLLNVIQKPNVYEGIQDTLDAFNKWIANSSKDLDINIKNDDYISVPLTLLKASKVLPCDIYLPVNENKKIKILNQGDDFNNEDFEKYTKKDISVLNIERENIKTLIDSVCDSIEMIINDKNKTKDEKIFDVHSVVLDTVKSLGISQEAQKAAAQGVNYALDVIKGDRSLDKISKRLFSKEERYLSKHSVALAYVTNAIISNTHWNSIENKYTLSLVSLFHDASALPFNFEESRYTDEGREGLNLNVNHPQEAINLLKNWKNLDADIEQIILEHHERPDGSGFPKKLRSHNLKPLSSLFIFCHDIVDAIIWCHDNNKEINHKNILEIIDESIYKDNHFARVLEAFKKTKLFENEQ